jgi:hypothetical protein
MRLLGLEIGRAEKRAVQITQNATREEMVAFFGMDPSKLPTVNVQSALRVPAFAAGVNFLSRTLATPTLEAFRETPNGPVRLAAGFRCWCAMRRIRNGRATPPGSISGKTCFSTAAGCSRFFA